ncbi:MAG: antibiotic biosynthesis monooxygenase [Xanthobacteraceae bacterium]|nr:antibiotic biosynthesis monooxygenase [Xanthobacteraceae bacterium]
MFSVIFEVHPKSEEWESYLGIAKMLKPELEQIDGFIDNVRYASLRRPGWLLSLSSWRDEKALVRWRTRTTHHGSQQQGRDRIMQDYHLRVGEITRDNNPPGGLPLIEQRLDETIAGESTTVTLIDARQAAAAVEATASGELATSLGLPSGAEGLVAWDVFDAVLSPGDVILLMSWRTRADAERFENAILLPSGARLRRVRVIRDYGMFDRREAPQYYPDAKGRTTVHG